MHLRDFLGEAGYTYNEFGKEIGRDASYVYRLATFQAWPGKETMISIIHATSGKVMANDMLES